MPLLLIVGVAGCDASSPSPDARSPTPDTAAVSAQPPTNAREQTKGAATTVARPKPDSPPAEAADDDSPAAVQQPGAAIGADKKLIGFACNTVEPAYLKEHVADIERLPLDGLNISVYPDDWGPQRSGQEGMFFGGRRFTSDDFRHSLADLKQLYRNC